VHFDLADARGVVDRDGQSDEIVRVLDRLACPSQRVHTGSGGFEKREIRRQPERGPVVSREDDHVVAQVREDAVGLDHREHLATGVEAADPDQDAASAEIVDGARHGRAQPSSGARPSTQPTG
jgi:hypothetical protein